MEETGIEVNSRWKKRVHCSRINLGSNLSKTLSMAGNAESDADRLLECFQRRMAQQRIKTQGSGDQRLETPSKLPSSRQFHPTSNVASSDESVQTPQGKEHRLGNPLGGACHPSVAALRENRTVCKQISPGVFYGSPQGKPATTPPRLLSLLNDIRRDLSRQNKSREAELVEERTQTLPIRTAIWATFPRQEQAVQFAESNTEENLVVFQYQDHIHGQRRFLATSYAEFWHRYVGMNANFRHHYEIIQEGKPCHLYFDLEFNRRANMEADGEAMVDTLLSVVAQTFKDIFRLSYDPSWTVELDSSTADKFSRHLVIHAQQAVFKNNMHVGSFVGEVCRRIHEGREGNEDASRLFVLQGESRATYQTALFVDQGVYSRNRSFRLPFSSKAGKTAKLLPTKRFRCKTLGDMAVFMESLICRVDDKCERLLTFGLEDTVRGGSLDFASWKNEPAYQSKRPAFCVTGKSPFPSLDTFVESVACIGNVAGRIRSWYWFSEYGVVVYNISENRFCENIGRPHKSNGVMYIVDFRTAGYYQKCHDPDCRGYRSDLRPIPRHTIPPEYPLSSARQVCIFKKTSAQNELYGLEEEEDDAAWWEEVISSMSSLECASQSQTQSQIKSQTQSQAGGQDSHLSQDVVDEDDEWWLAVEQELIKIESVSVARVN